MAVVTDRVRERAVRDFGPTAPRALRGLEAVPIRGGVDPERVHAAVLIAARANAALLTDALEHAEHDWRDLLDRAGLADPGWEDVVSAALGPA